MKTQKLTICTYCQGDCQVHDSRGKQPIDGPKMKRCPVCGGRGVTTPSLAGEYDGYSLSEMEDMQREAADEARFERMRDDE